MRAALVALTMCLLAVPANAKYSDGTGEPNDPYQIATAADLIALGETPEDYDKHFILTADIDLDPNLPGRKVFDKAVIAPDTDPVKDYYQGTSFTGVFDGNGHRISHLTITGSGYLGLFGLLDTWEAPGEVKNLGMVDVVVMGSGGTIGGLVGGNGGSITMSYSTGSVSGGSSVGGLVGHNWGSIAASYSTGSVSGNAKYSSVGGLVGYNSWGGSIATSCSTGSVSGTTEHGSVGGLVGGNSGSIATSYSTGSVSGTTEHGSVGGLVGSGSPERVIYGVWDTETSGLLGSAGGVGLTTAEMMDPYLLGLNGFANDPNWVLEAGRDYPRLAWEGPFGQTIPETQFDWLEGEGTAEEPYRIDTASQLVLLGKASVLWDDHFVLGADIDLDPALSGSSAFGQAVIAAFTGVFDGGGHAISNLTIDGSSYLGLFGLVSSPAEVRNVRVVYVNVTGSGHCIGGLMGANGVDGYYYSTSGAMVANCHSSGSVGGGERVGGLVGENWRGSITNCSSSGSVSGLYSHVGGLVGWSFGIIDSCRSSGMVRGGECVGGLVGSIGIKVGNCYSTSSVSGTQYVGGLVGYGGVNLWEVGASGEIAACYSTGRVSGTGSEYVGGLVGAYSDTVASFWDIQTSGQTTSAGGTGLTTAEMQTAQTFLDAGWGSVSAWPWWILEGRDYPRLSWEAPVERNAGSGTEEDPHRIYTAEQLVFLGKASDLWDKHFILAADIDLDPNLPGGQVFTKALISSFAGVFDGNGHVISGLTIEGSGPLGLFGELASGSSVKNLGLADVSIAGSASSVGALAALSQGSVTHCYSTGSIRGCIIAGGLVGSNKGNVTQCYSTSAVSGWYAIGGLTGFNNGSVTECYAVGEVSGDSLVGGLVGGGEATSISLSFWDIETSGQATSSGGVGKTTVEMQTPSTFLDAGWDFVGETENGTEDIWWIFEGKDYPRLWWELDEPEENGNN